MRCAIALLTTACLLAGAVGCGKKEPPRDFTKENVERWKSEAVKWGGWDGWEKTIGPFQEDVKKALADRPAEIQGIVGLDGWLFFRRSLEVLVGGDLRKQPEGKDPFPAIVDFNNQLKARGVDMLFCPVPVKAAVYPEKISKNAPAPGGPYVDPYTRKLMLELSEAGVECVDLLPVFVEERDRAPAGDAEPFYMVLDTHWSHRALRTAAHVFAERIKAYPWYGEVSRKVKYTTVKATSKRRGDVVQMLPEAERVNYRPMTLVGEQVLKPEGAPYEDDAGSPIVLLGDSYAGVYHLEDCKNGGLTAHIAKETGTPLELVLGQGMGPNVRMKWFRYKGADALKGKKLVIWVLSERDLYNYTSPWAKMPLP